MKSWRVYVDSRWKAAPLTGQGGCCAAPLGSRSLRPFRRHAHSALADNGLVASQPTKTKSYGVPRLVGIVGESDFTNGNADDDARHVKLPKVGSVASRTYAANTGLTWPIGQQLMRI